MENVFTDGSMLVPLNEYIPQPPQSKSTGKHINIQAVSDLRRFQIILL
jgi:hypothetical protein